MFSYRNRGHLEAGERRTQTPDGVPAPTGYYPNIYRGTDTPGTKPVPHVFQHNKDTSPYDPDWQQFDRTIMKQRMPVERVSSTWVPDHSERNSGIVDPLESGPVPTTIRMLSREYMVQRGTSNTRNMDNNITQKSPYGQQDGASWTETIDPIRSNYKLSPPSDESSLVRVAPSGPHGLHSQLPLAIRKQSNTKRLQRPQQQAARQNRLANSPYVGQSFSATTQQAAPTPQRGAKRGLR